MWPIKPRKVKFAGAFRLSSCRLALSSSKNFLPLCAVTTTELASPSRQELVVHPPRTSPSLRTTFIHLSTRQQNDHPDPVLFLRQGTRRDAPRLLRHLPVQQGYWHLALRWLVISGRDISSWSMARRSPMGTPYLRTTSDSNQQQLTSDD